MSPWPFSFPRLLSAASKFHPQSLLRPTPALRQWNKSASPPLISSLRRTFTTSVSAPAYTSTRPPRRKSPRASRGPESSEPTTDLSALDVLGNTPAPSTAVDMCTQDGFVLNSGLKIVDGGALLIGGEAFRWRPWLEVERKGEVAEGRRGDTKGGGVLRGAEKLRDMKGAWDAPEGAWGVLEVVWPKPDLLIIGTGVHVLPISQATRKRINDLGIRLEIQDTRNAAAQFNLLATERGVHQVAAALMPIA